MKYNTGQIIFKRIFLQKHKLTALTKHQNMISYFRNSQKRVERKVLCPISRVRNIRARNFTAKIG